MARFRTRSLAAAAGPTLLATGISAPAASAAIVQTGTIICQPTQNVSISSDAMGTTTHTAWSRSGTKKSWTYNHDYTRYHRSWTITPWDITSGTKIEAPYIQGSYTSKNFYCVG